MEIYLIRHTTVEVTLEVCYGQTDIGLADTYKKEFEIVKSKIPDIKELTFFSSPLKRCTLLADYLSESNYTTDDRLKEIYLGDWELKPWKFVEQNLFFGWQKDFLHNKCPGGESFNDLCNRSIDFYEEIIQKGRSKIAIVAHMGVIRVILGHVLGMPRLKYVCLKMDYGGVSKIDILPAKTNVMFFNK